MLAITSIVAIRAHYYLSDKRSRLFGQSSQYFRHVLFLLVAVNCIPLCVFRSLQ